MNIDESEILLFSALAGALPYALTALVDWSRQHSVVHLPEFLHRLGAGRHGHN